MRAATSLPPVPPSHRSGGAAESRGIDLVSFHRKLGVELNRHAGTWRFALVANVVLKDAHGLGFLGIHDCGILDRWPAVFGSAERSQADRDVLGRC